MYRVVVVEKNKDGKIELTKEELQKMLSDAYDHGYYDRSIRLDTITYPTYDKFTANNNGTVTDHITVTCSQHAAENALS